MSTGGTTGTGGSVLTCSGGLTAATSPVVVAATLTCNSAAWLQQASVAAGSTNHGVVSLLGDIGIAPGFVFDITPSGVQVQQLASADSISQPSNASGAFGVITAGVELTSISWSARSGSSGPLTTTSVMDTASSSRFVDGAIGPDGTQYAVFQRDDATLALLSRAVGASAFTAAADDPVLTPYWPRLVIDSSKMAHLLSWIPGQGLVDSPQGKPQVTLFASTAQSPPGGWRPSRPGGLDLAASVMLADGVHVLRRGTGSALDDLLIAGTAAANAPVPLSPITCNSGICTAVAQMGDFASSAALAQAGDGTLWLVTFRDHLDRTIPYKYAGGEACQCQATLNPADDHSTHMLALQRIAPGASAPSAILWSQSLPVPPWSTINANNSTLDASFFGTSLFLTLPWGKTLSYLVIDTSSL